MIACHFNVAVIASRATLVLFCVIAVRDTVFSVGTAKKCFVVVAHKHPFVQNVSLCNVISVYNLRVFM